MANIRKCKIEIIKDPQIEAVHKELNNCLPKVSNLEKMLSRSLEKLRKLSAEWVSSTLDKKRVIQKILYPEGIFYDAKNHTVLTGKTNFFVALTRIISEHYSVMKTGIFNLILKMPEQ